MRLSVIIPIYNAERTLRRCLDSLVSQIEDSTELILVNDGSTDGTDAICQEYCKAYNNIQYITQDNSGVSAARNHGLRVATGEFVSFVDSDDTVTDQYFDILEESLESDLLVFCAQIIRNGVYYDSISPEKLAKADSLASFMVEFVRTRNGSPWNKRFRRTLIEENGITFPEDLRIGEDYVFCIRYLLCTRSAKAVLRCAYIVDESNQQSISRRYSPDSYLQALRNYQYTFDAISQSMLITEQKDELLKVLDYNYFRTSFACVKQLFKAEMTRSEKLGFTKTILEAFAANDRKQPSISLVHRLSKTVVRRSWFHIAYVIAWIHEQMR